MRNQNCPVDPHPAAGKHGAEAPSTRERLFKWTDRGVLFPAAVLFCLTTLLLSNGQLRSLGNSLAAVLAASSDSYAGGFRADFGDLVMWWSSCGLLLWAGALYLNPVIDSPRGLRLHLYLEELGLHWLAAALVLSPLLAAGINGWDPQVALSLAVTGPLIWSTSTLPAWQRWLCLISLTAAIGAIAHHQELAASAMLIIWLGVFYFHPKLTSPVYRALAALAVAMGFFLAVGGTIFATGMLAEQYPTQFRWNERAALLAVWWVCPGLWITLLFTLPAATRGRVAAAGVIACSLIVCVAVYYDPHWLIGSATLCVLAAMGLAVGSLLRERLGRTVRHVVGYGALAGLLWSLVDLGPTPARTSSRVAVTPVADTGKEFAGFYTRWLSARGESPDRHGPLLLVAVAGGGVRASAHASIVLALADDVFKDKFGDRTLAISAVSGGAVGVATWLGQRAENLPPAPHSEIRSGGISPMALQLARFYQHDFVSPTVNRLLTHDMAWSFVPSVHRSDRDRVLAELWASSWDDLWLGAGAKPPAQTIFRRSVASLAADPGLPLVIFNATSAADGRHAVYASSPINFPGSWSLDPSTSVMDAAADSARFAVVSPIGHACGFGGESEARQLEPGMRGCRPGYIPVTVADGGYLDNSGLASIETVLDELVKLDAQLSNVYVVVIESNPEVGLSLREGRRFDNGRALPEVVAPLFVQEAARSARSGAFAERIARRIPPSQMIVWDLSNQHLAEAFSKMPVEKAWHMEWMNNKFTQAEFIRRLHLVPLGWTLDPQSFSQLHSNAISANHVPVVGNCDSMKPEFTVLCRVLPNARSPK